ncbi:hypothetical protein GGF37_004044 [Kickxella alabastrina]|nr:hypothetical protein GGF37_004044 [Kickxella alabastrina]
MHFLSIVLGTYLAATRSLAPFVQALQFIDARSGYQRPILPYHLHHKNKVNNISFVIGDNASSELASWIQQHDEFSKQRILANIAPFAHDTSAMAGAVCASPSRSNPDYYYSWTRDSALVMNEIISWIDHDHNHNHGLDPTYADTLINTLNDYVAFTRYLQSIPGLKYGLAEAKFHMNGTQFTRNWCNGQTDGPAIRAYTLVRYAWYLISHGRDVAHLYDRRMYKRSPIKTDLEFVAKVWAQNQHCDIWEETRGMHFYTLMAQRRALIEGAQLARLLNDEGAAIWYEQQAEMIGFKLPQFWDEHRGHVLTTVLWSGGLASKRSNLDSQVLLASLHAGLADGVFTVESQQMTATVLRLLRAFGPMYSINQALTTDINGATVAIGVAAGRYPEDVYNGVGVSKGNPWSLITSAMAEYHYRLATTYARAGQLLVTNELLDLIKWTSNRHRKTNGLSSKLLGLKPGDNIGNDMTEFHDLVRYLLNAGDLYMARVYLHTSRDHTMYEQWYSHTGYGRGAIHLTWSYAAHMAASGARSRLLAAIY